MAIKARNQITIIDVNNEYIYDGIYKNGLKNWSEDKHNYIKPKDIEVINTIEAEYGGSILKFNKSNTIYASELIPVHNSSNYKINIRAKSSKESVISAGFILYDENKNAIPIDNLSYIVTSTGLEVRMNNNPIYVEQESSSDSIFRNFQLVKNHPLTAIWQNIESVFKFDKKIKYIKPVFKAVSVDNSSTFIDCFVIEDITNVSKSIESIFKDSSITPIEKKTLRNTLENIKKEKEELLKTAQQYDVSCTNYLNSFNSLIAIMDIVFEDMSKIYDDSDNNVINTFISYYLNRSDLKYEIELKQKHNADNKLDNDAEDVFNALTDNGKIQGIYMENGQLYINGEYINAKNLRVVDENGDLTLGVDNKGNVTIRASYLSIGSKPVASKDDVMTEVDDKISDVKSEIELTTDSILQKVESTETEIIKQGKASSQNLLNNSDFKIMNGSYPDLWTVSDSKKITFDSGSTILDGIGSYYFNVTGETSDKWYAVYSPFIDAKKGEKFVASAYVNSGDKWASLDRGGSLEIEYIKSDGTRISTSSTSINKSASGWQRLIVKGTAPQDTAKVRMRVHPVRNGNFNMSKPMLQVGEECSAWQKGIDVVNMTTRMKSAESKITEDAITNTVKKNFYTKGDVDGKGYQNASQVQQTVDKFELKFEESGGYNHLINSDFKRDLEKWSTTKDFDIAVSKGGLSSPSGYGARITGQIGKSGFLVQHINDTKVVSNNSFTISAYINISSKGGTDPVTDGSANAFRIYSRVIYTDDTKEYFHAYNKSASNSIINKWQKVSISFNRASGKKIKEINFSVEVKDTTRYMYISQAMLENGILTSPWSPNPNEVYDGITTIDKDGVTVTSSNVKSKTSMTSSGFKITKTDTNEDVFKVNSDGTLNLKGQMTITGGNVPSSALSGTIDNNRLNSSIVSGATNGTNAKGTLDSNKNNWINAYNRVSQWAYGAVTGSTTINGGLIQTNTIMANKIAIGDFTNLCHLHEINNVNGNTVITHSDGYKYFRFGATSPGYHKLDFFNTTSSNFRTGDSFRIKYNGWCQSSTSCTFILRAYYTDGTWANLGSVATGITTSNAERTVQLNVTSGFVANKTLKNVVMFAEVGNVAGYFYMRTIGMYRMSTGELIVDGSITTNKIAAGAVTANMITTGTLDASKVNVTNLNASNIKSGTINVTGSLTTQSSGSRSILQGDGINFYNNSTHAGKISHDITGSGSTNEAKERLWIRSVGSYALKLQSGGDMSIEAGNSSSKKTIWISGSKTIINNQLDVYGNILVGTDWVLTSANKNGYYGMKLYNNDTKWIRTTSSGLLPYQSGGASSLGTSSWNFNTIYGKTLYENNQSLANKYFPINGGNMNGSLVLKSGFLRVNGLTVFNASYYPGLNANLIRGDYGVMAIEKHANTSSLHGRFHFLDYGGRPVACFGGSFSAKTFLNSQSYSMVKNKKAFDILDNLEVTEQNEGKVLLPKSTALDERNDSKEDVYSNYVSLDSTKNGEFYVTTNINSMIGVLVEAVKELKDENKALKKSIDEINHKKA